MQRAAERGVAAARPLCDGDPLPGQDAPPAQRSGVRAPGGGMPVAGAVLAHRADRQRWHRGRGTEQRALHEAGVRDGRPG
jgi:hypothetical protein